MQFIHFTLVSAPNKQSLAAKFLVQFHSFLVFQLISKKISAWKSFVIQPSSFLNFRRLKIFWRAKFQFLVKKTCIPSGHKFLRRLNFAIINFCEHLFLWFSRISKKLQNLMFAKFYRFCTREFKCSQNFWLTSSRKFKFC